MDQLIAEELVCTVMKKSKSILTTRITACLSSITFFDTSSITEKTSNHEYETVMPLNHNRTVRNRREISFFLEMCASALLILISFAMCPSATSLPTPSLHTTGTHGPGTYGPGCLYQGTFYPPGEIDRGTDGMSWCYGTVCHESGSVYVWDNFNCGTTPLPTKLPSTTLPPATTLAPASHATTLPQKTPSPSTPPGCFHNGKLHAPGKILQVPEGNRTWCYRAVCNESGNVFHWRNYDYCRTTPLPTTGVLPTPTGCYFKGTVYPPGEIERGNDGQGWCYGTYCNDNHEIAVWDNFECWSTTAYSTNGSKVDCGLPMHFYAIVLFCIMYTLIGVI